MKQLVDGLISKTQFIKKTLFFKRRNIPVDLIALEGKNIIEHTITHDIVWNIILDCLIIITYLTRYNGIISTEEVSSNMHKNTDKKINALFVDNC